MAIPIIFFGLGGLVFCMLGCVYIVEGLDAWNSDTFGFAIGSSWGTDWHRSFSVADHPLLFALRMSLDVTGALGAIGVGLLIFGALVSITASKTNPLVRKMGSLGKPWLIAPPVVFAAHFALMTVPYLMAFLGIP